MGYNIQIVRKKDYDNFEEESDITLLEWQRYLLTDPDLKLSKTFFGLDDTPGEGFVIWEKGSEENAWLDFYKGQIYSKNPSESTIRKMMSIAEKLNAKVQGDDGEIYNEELLAEITKPASIQISKKKWWEVWK